MPCEVTNFIEALSRLVIRGCVIIIRKGGGGGGFGKLEEVGRGAEEKKTCAKVLSNQK